MGQLPVSNKQQLDCMPTKLKCANKHGQVQQPLVVAAWGLLKDMHEQHQLSSSGRPGSQSFIVWCDKP
jgi:hypothetical protein